MLRKYSSEHLVVLALRLLLVFVFYFFCRIGFFIANLSFFESVGFGEFLELCFWGLRFDLTAILYLNALFILLNLLPFRFRLNKKYQKVTFYLYIIPNIIGLLANCVDFAYFPFILHRSTLHNLSFFRTEKNFMSILAGLALDF